MMIPMWCMIHVHHVIFIVHYLLAQTHTFFERISLRNDSRRRVRSWVVRWWIKVTWWWWCIIFTHRRRSRIVFHIGAALIGIGGNLTGRVAFWSVMTRSGCVHVRLRRRRRLARTRGCHGFGRFGIHHVIGSVVRTFRSAIAFLVFGHGRRYFCK